ncbi:hypothetical protein NIES2100_27040 [Calothrix sp. NIES-2100]|uniref:biotin carboxylase n=1 Tax=Calothrix sp. NIES-2100 TaxID=1954172 RepID=UPI000B6003E1|nr:hypothetical protein NIES2100_27040 [Calothrix sp. NIES-2100]
MTQSTLKLQSIADIRRFLLANERPLFFISPTNFNLLGMDEWVKNFSSITYRDCWDKRCPHHFTPSLMHDSPFENIHNLQEGPLDVVDYNNYLLRHPEVIDYIKQFGSQSVALFLMFDEETEALCERHQIEIWFPSAQLRNKLDNKIETVRLGNLAGVPSVPNCLSNVDSYPHLLDLARIHNLGQDLVIQTAFGDSGHTTFFIANETDWKNYADKIRSSGVVKIMKRINCAPATQEACITKVGTIVAPLQTEVIGFPELTPDRGGWSGNELFSGAFTPAICHQAQEYTLKFAEQLRKVGYRGYFDLDYLIDRQSGQLYLSEINPRISGVTPLTSHSAFATAQIPLFLFHLLEFADVEFELDVHGFNTAWLTDSLAKDCWGSLIIKHTKDSIEQVIKAPQSGIWSMDDAGNLDYSRFDHRCHSLNSKTEALVQRVAGVGNYRYCGGDIVRIIVRDRVMTDDFQLSDRAKLWIDSILAEYQTEVVYPSSSIS